MPTPKFKWFIRHLLEEGDVGFVGKDQTPAVVAETAPFKEWIFVYLNGEKIIRHSIHFSEFSFEKKDKFTFQE